MAAARQGRGPGRPRDETIDGRVLDATRSLLASVGFSATTVQAIARASGVPVSAIYRRWSSRLELIEDSVAPAQPQLPPPTGDLVADLRLIEAGLRAAFTAPAARAAMPALLAAYAEGHTGRPAETAMRDSWRPPFYAALAAAGPDAVDPSLDPDDLFDVLLGVIFVEAFVPTTAARPPHPVDASALIGRLARR